MIAELFTVTPTFDGPVALAQIAPDGQGIRVTIQAPPVLVMACSRCSWSFRYGQAELPALLAHAEEHSALHPAGQDQWPE